MSTRHADDPKRRSLARAGTLHPKADQVSDALFVDNPFFDPRDLLQVKYEMLRAQSTERKTIAEVCRLFGFSRESFRSCGRAVTVPPHPGQSGVPRIRRILPGPYA